MAAAREGGIRLSSLCPKFLHTNSTSHTWPFSAIAELIDNAYDPDVNAKQIWIDKTLIKNIICLTFMDNGNGMSQDKLHKMLSFGFSDKVTVSGRVPVGLYGNGFKSGSMRLGKDAIVFTKSETGMSVGMLSQTYLERIKAEHVIVPIIAFNRQRHLVKSTDSAANLNAILKHSLFSTEKDLLAELDAIIGKKGTRIILWNLRCDKRGQSEFDFNKDKYDIRIPEDLDEVAGKRGYRKQERIDQIPPESDYSLRAYCSILYLKPRMQIVIRGQKVKTQLVSKSLAYIESDIYRPKFLAPKTVKITFGYNCRNKEHYGIMMYHKNRLIKAYERVGCQLKANNMGVGVVGVIECNFLKPTHNKQDFDYTNEYRLTMAALGEKLNDYWNEMKLKKCKDEAMNIPIEEVEKRPDQTWVQCDTCLKWRKLPDGILRLPEKWHCSMNPDPQFRDCNEPEEPEDEDPIHPTYEKTYKKRDKEQPKIRSMEQNQLSPMGNFVSKWPTMSSNKDLPMPSLIGGVESATKCKTTVTASNFALGSANTMSTIPMITSSPSVSDSYSNKRPLLSNNSTPVSTKKPKLNKDYKELIVLEDGDDTDVIILEETSTPKPKGDSDTSRLETKKQVDVTEGAIPMERLDDIQPGGKISAGVKREQWTTATQTDTNLVFVKKEENDAFEQPRMELPTGGQENVIDSTFSAPDTAAEIYELEKQLLLVDQERDSYRTRCDMLTMDMKRLEQQLVEMHNKYVKKEFCHQATETDQSLENMSENCVARLGEMTSLYEQATKEIESVKMQCTTLQNLKSECSKCALNQNGETNNHEMDDMAVQLDNVFRQLDACTVEKDRYKSEVELLEMEKSQQNDHCDQLRTEVAQLKFIIQGMRNGDATTSTVETVVSTSEDESIKLRSLRVNVGQLLATMMLDLDLKQVNYDSDAIDEMLGHLLEKMYETNA
ncbi:MORC family CW-type zinc finger protein 3 [Microcaecilia unicolor]|uniref:MORC family CW-type zinc finger protein 3 n=1 Tax=Microcaecilia unicolor TaxID=1415580 RepID=A0A6P7XZT5_9AMPH|nr:MORC family CW-type zinc finger protein 3 [Microcaecilia unicolor]